MATEDREPGAPADVSRRDRRHRTDVNLAVATLAFRQRPMRILADDVAGPLRATLIVGGGTLGRCKVLDISARGLGIVLEPGISVWLGMSIDEVKVHQGEILVGEGPAEIVNLLDGAHRRAGLRMVGKEIELRHLVLLDGSRADPQGGSPESAVLPADWRAAVAELGQILRWSGFFLDHATRPMGDALTPAQERAVFSDFFAQWAPRCLGSLARLFDLSSSFDEAQVEAGHLHARRQLLRDVYPGAPPIAPEHGVIDDYQLPALYLGSGFDASTLHARFLRHAWSWFPLVRTVLARPDWLGEQWAQLRSRPHARVLVIQPGPAAELGHIELADGQRLEVTLLETDEKVRALREAGWHERWPAAPDDLHVGTRTPTGLPALAKGDAPYDLIYGAGVLGGLGDDDARALVRTAFEQVAPGGRLVLGNLEVDPITTWLLDYVLHWPLRYRDAAAVRALVPDDVARIASAVTVEADPSGRASVLTVQR